MPVPKTFNSLVMTLLCSSLLHCYSMRADASAGWDSCTGHFPQGITPDYIEGHVAICRDGFFAVSYDPEMQNPSWAAYKITKKNATDNIPGSLSYFSKDADLDALGVTHPSHSNEAYNSLWNRGHVAPNMIMSGTDASKASTYKTSNIAPQWWQFNQQSWATLESRTFDFVKDTLTHDDSHLFIVTGVGYENRTGGDVVKVDDVAIPTFFFKALCDPQAQESVAFIGNNSEDGGGLMWSYRSVDEVAAMAFCNATIHSTLQRTLGSVFQLFPRDGTCGSTSTFNAGHWNFPSYYDLGVGSSFNCSGLAEAQAAAQQSSTAPGGRLWYQFNGGNLQDSLGANHATSGPTATTYGLDRCNVLNQAAVLAGTTGSYIRPPGTIWNSMEDFSISFWHIGLAATDEAILSVYASGTAAFLLWELLPASAQIRLTFDGTTVTTASAVYTHGQWNHFATTRQGTTLKFYVNGQYLSTHTVSTGNFSSSLAPNAFVIGQKQTALGVYDPTFSSNSRIKDFRIFNEYLSPSHMDRLGRANLCAHAAFVDRPFIRYRMSTKTVSTTIYDAANTGQASMYTGLNVLVSTGYSTLCWTVSGHQYTGAVGSYSSLGSGPAVGGLQDFTISLWVRERAHVAHDACLLSVAADLTYAGSPDQSHEFLFCIRQDFSVTLSLQHEEIISGASTVGMWPTGLVAQFVTVTREGPTVKLYLNGDLKHTATQDMPLPLGNIPTNGMYLAQAQNAAPGVAGFSATQSYQGDMQELQIWGKALSATEVARMYDLKCEQLLHWWPLVGGNGTNDQGSEPAAPLTANSITATDDHCPGSGNAAEYAGTDSSYFAGDGSAVFRENIQDFTVGVWLYVAVLPGTLGVFFSVSETGSDGNSLYLGVKPDGKIEMFLKSVACATSSASIPVGTWFHLLAYRQKNSVKMFIDSVSVASATGCSTDPLESIPSNGFYLGQDQGSTPGPAGFTAGAAFAGKMRDVRFYNYALTAAAEYKRWPAPHVCGATLNKLLHYDLGRTGANQIDRSTFGNVNWGTMTNPTTHASPSETLCSPSSSYFAGTSAEYADLGPSGPMLAGLNDFTLSIWLKEADKGSSITTIISAGWTSALQELSVWWDPNTGAGQRSIFAHVADANKNVKLYIASLISENEPLHLAIVRQGRFILFYLNGVLDQTLEQGFQHPIGPIPSNGFVLTQDQDSVGGGFSSTQAFQGWLSDFKMWNRALTANEILVDKALCGMIGWWPLAGEMTDLAAGQHDGALVGTGTSPTIDSCNRVGQATSFPGTANDFARLNDGSYLSHLYDFTIAVWVKPRVISTYPALINMYSSDTGLPDPNNELLVMLLADGGVRVLVAGSAAHSTAGSLINLNAWNHVIFARSAGGFLDIWVNGVHAMVNQASTGTLPLRPIYSNGVLIGQKQDTGTGPGVGGAGQSLDGDMRDLRIYSYPLQSVEGIQGLPAVPVCPTHTSPLFRYRLNRLNMDDSSGNAFHGTLGSGITTAAPLTSCPSGPSSLNWPSTSTANDQAVGAAGPALAGINDFTFALWVKDLDVSTGQGSPISLFASYLDGSSTASEISFRRNTGDTLRLWLNQHKMETAPGTFPANQEIHWVVTRKARTVKVFKDGVEILSVEGRTQFPLGAVEATGFILGQEQGTLAGTFTAIHSWLGIISDFQFWEGSMDAAQAASMFNENCATTSLTQSRSLSPSPSQSVTASATTNVTTTASGTATASLVPTPTAPVPQTPQTPIDFTVDSMVWSGGVMAPGGTAFHLGQVRTAALTVAVTKQVTSTTPFTVTCTADNAGEAVLSLLASPAALTSSLATSDNTLRNAGTTFTMALSMLVVAPFASGSVELQCSAGAGGGIAWSNLTLTGTTTPFNSSTAPTLLSTHPAFGGGINHQPTTPLNVTLQGLNLDALPHRLMVGPYLVRITHSNSSHAIAHLPPAVTCGQVMTASLPPVFNDGTDPAPDAAFTTRQGELDSSNLTATIYSLCSGKSSTFLLTADLFHWHLTGNTSSNPTQWAPTLQMKLTSLRAVVTTSRRRSSPASSNNTNAVLEAGDSPTPVRLSFSFEDSETGAVIAPEDLGLYATVPYTTTVSYSPGQTQPLAVTSSSVATVEFEVSAPMDQQAPLSLYLHRTWGPRQYNASLSIPVQRPSLSVIATQASRWVALFTLSTNTTWGVARNVMLDVSPEAAVRLNVSSNSTYCTPGMQCTIPTLAAGATVQIYAAVSNNLKYNFNGAAVLRYQVNTDNGNSVVDGRIVMSPDPSQNSSVVVTSPRGAASVSSKSIFGGEGALRCMDAFFFSTISSIVLLAVVFTAAQFCYRDNRPNAAKPDTWKSIPLWRSLMVQHAWCVVPCHSQCALNHVLPLLAHLFTLLLFCAVISTVFKPTNTAATTISAVVALLLVVTVRPLLCSVYYFTFTWAKMPNGDFEGTITRPYGMAKSATDATISPHQRHLLLTNKSFAETEGDLDALGAVELAEEDEPDQEELEDDVVEIQPKKEDGGGDAQGTDGARTQEETPADMDDLEVLDVDDDLDDDLDLDMDDPDTDHKEEGTPLGPKDQGQKGVANDSIATMGRLRGEAQSVVEDTPPLGPRKGSSYALPPLEGSNTYDPKGNSVTIRPTGNNHCWSVKMVVAPFRKKGHVVVLVLLGIVFVLGMITLTMIQTGDKCQVFERAFLIALVADVCFVQPLVVIFTWSYRWLQSDEDDTIWSELHPFDGAEREM